MLRRARRAGLIDRDPQNLPVPLGGLSPRRQPHAVAIPIRLWRRRRAEVIASIGLLLAIAAAVLTVTRPALAVYLEGDTVHVGGLTLSHPSGNGGLTEGRLYTGAATLLLITHANGSVVASSVTYLGGQRATGVCSFGPPTATAVTERCVLHIGATSITCDDALRFAAPGSWRRRCSDGQMLTVAVPSGAEVIPLPFPLDR
jgi:hypothetical protein